MSDREERKASRPLRAGLFLNDSNLGTSEVQFVPRDKCQKLDPPNPCVDSIGRQSLWEVIRARYHHVNPWGFQDGIGSFIRRGKPKLV